MHNKVKFVSNNEGEQKVIHNNYEYYKKRELVNSVRWECELPHCKASIWTSKGDFLKASAIAHKHGPDYDPRIENNVGRI